MIILSHATALGLTAEVHVCPPANAADADWSDFDDQKGKYPCQLLPCTHFKGDLKVLQLDAVASAAALVRIARGAYSAGKSHGMASKPTAKKKLNPKSMTTATIRRTSLIYDDVH